MSLAFEAMRFARIVHAEQRRKYTGAPYTEHLGEVAGIVATVQHPTDMLATRDVLLATAWLHDCVEDQGVSPYELSERFGEQVMQGVMYLSDMEVGDRTTRKRLSRDRLAQAPGWVQSIKCADLISNTASILEHDPKFAVLYLEEKRLLLSVLTRADGGLLQMANGMANKL